MPQEELVSYYAMLELVWHLSEILFIELLPVGCLIQQLLEWVQRNGSELASHPLLSSPLLLPRYASASTRTRGGMSH